jgi:hypothetical protein
MNPVAAAILDELRDASPAERTVRFSSLVNSRQGDEPLGVERDFADKDNWTKLQPEWLDTVPALSFLSNEAICFYIPAYLAADLAGRLRLADPAFALVHGFDDMSREQRIWRRSEETWSDYARARWSGLTQEQVLAVVHYLEWRVTRDGVDLEHGIVEALKAYWYARAASA